MGIWLILKINALQNSLHVSAFYVNAVIDIFVVNQSNKEKA